MSKQEHPIDKLFAAKLQGRETTPSAQAWSRLEGGLQQKKAHKKGMIWWSCAAAVLVLIVSGCLWISVYKEPGGMNIADLANAASGDVKNEAFTHTIPETLTTRPEQPENTVANEYPLAAVSPETTVLEKPKATTQRLAKVNKPVKTGQPLAVREENRPIAIAHKPVLPVASPDEEVAAHQTPAPVASPVTAENNEQTLVVVVQLPEEKNENAAPGKNQRKAEKLWENIKKVKHGEFRELGLAPDELMARLRDKKELQKN